MLNRPRQKHSHAVKFGVPLENGRYSLTVNPAHAVRGPKHTQRKGKTPVLNVDEARTLIDAIDVTSLPGLRDRALMP